MYYLLLITSVQAAWASLTIKLDFSDEILVFSQMNSYICGSCDVKYNAKMTSYYAKALPRSDGSVRTGCFTL